MSFHRMISPITLNQVSGMLESLCYYSTKTEVIASKMYNSFVIAAALDLSRVSLPSTSRASTACLPDETETPDRDCFAVSNLLEINQQTGKGEVPQYKLLTEGCGCQRNCITKFTTEELVQSHLGATELNYYSKDHVNHLNLFAQSNNILPTVLHIY